jgi:hypothetical protein
MAVNHPIIKYRLTAQGRIPDYLCGHEGSFGGMYGVNTNKPGYVPRWPSPQETQKQHYKLISLESQPLGL